VVHDRREGWGVAQRGKWKALGRGGTGTGTASGTGFGHLETRHAKHIESCGTMIFFRGIAGGGNKYPGQGTWPGLGAISAIFRNQNVIWRSY
jgi:hypothetical protein